jgi:hypothetical protein
VRRSGHQVVRQARVEQCPRRDVVAGVGVLTAAEVAERVR